MSEVAGLGFIGMPWQVNMGSANLVGVAYDAEDVVARLD
jgi:UDP-N-acetyl-D-mannosaminuronate dehydrogenase